MPSPRDFKDLSERERAEAFARFELLRPCLESGVPLARRAREQAVPLRTAQRWLHGYRNSGLAGLARATRSDAGGFRRITAELSRLIKGLALEKPPPSASSVHRQVIRVAKEHGWPEPSYRSVAAMMSRIDPALRSLAHDGPKQYRERFDLLYRRESSAPNEIWQADHTPLDIWLLDDLGRSVRPWLTVILDDYSRAVCGYLLSFSAPNTLNTALSLRQAIWRKADPRWHVCGIPERFYTDHGSDFTSRHFEQVGADLKVELVFSTGGSPRGRGKIERFFQTVSQLFLCELPGYSPPNNRPVAPKLRLGELEARLHEFILDDYNSRLHSETGEAPQSRWEAGGFLPRMPESIENLDLLLLTVAKARKVHQDGIRFQGHRYLDITLAAYVGETVTIRYDPRDMAEIRIFHRDIFVCRAVCQELAGETISLKEIIAGRSRRRRELRGHLKDVKSAVDLYLNVHRAPPDEPQAIPTESNQDKPRLKRYYNE